MYCMCCGVWGHCTSGTFWKQTLWGNVWAKMLHGIFLYILALAVLCGIEMINNPCDTLLEKYHMVGNFCEGLIFVSFASPEPFMKIKTAKLLLSMSKVNEPCFNLSYLDWFSHQQKNVSECHFDSYHCMKSSRKLKCYVSMMLHASGFTEEWLHHYLSALPVVSCTR